MRWPPAALCLLSLTALPSCRKEVPCYGEVSVDDLYRQQKRMMDDGVELCPQHLAPKIVADGSGVSLDGRKLADRAELPSGSVRKVQALFTELKLYRERWKQLHPSKMFDAHATVVIGGELDALAGISVLQTTAFAGYPRMRVECAGVLSEIYWAVPGPPQPEGEAPSRETMRVMRSSDGWFTLSLPDSKPRVSDAHARDVPGLLSSVQEACSGRGGACAHILEIEAREGSFAEVARLVSLLMSAPAFSRRLPTLRLKAPGV